MTTIITPKSIPNKFLCETCDFKGNKKSDWDRHISTAKHKNTTNYNNSMQENASKIYTCECSKIYNHRASLYNHKKKCLEKGKMSIMDNDSNPKINDVVIDLLINENKEFKNVIIDLVKSNQDLQKQMLEVCQKNQPVNSNNTINNNNSHNKTFNLNFFLNEQCKDAMNLMDFVDTIQLKISDMERIGELGYVEGISNIIMENLNGMDIYKRPIHCSDAKRETMHIKDKGVWEKDTVNNDKMRKAIKHITWLNSKLLFAWAADHPGVIYSDHKLNDKYSEMILEAMGGKRNKTMEEGEAKIIKKISKMVLIDKINL
jgi:hypothetical protein